MRGGGLHWFCHMKIQLAHTFNNIIAEKNLLSAWGEFISDKRASADAQEFTSHLMDHIVSLHDDLSNRAYLHGGYESFFVNDPKRRHIHKASVRDRLLHHAVYRVLYPFFDRTFIADSYSCRLDKGVHAALNRFQSLAYRASHNHTRTVWVLKCDIRKFFASIDHAILMDIFVQYIPDQNVLHLLQNIIDSFHTTGRPGKGLPLGNLTSQLFANIYMNRFDQWVKHQLKTKHYIRYADDFVFLSEDKAKLAQWIQHIQSFLHDTLRLSLHPDKVFLKTIASGVDFLGWVHFSYHRILRRATKRRIFARIGDNPTDEALQSYLGLLEHGNAERLKKDVLAQYWLLS